MRRGRLNVLLRGVVYVDIMKCCPFGGVLDGRRRNLGGLSNGITADGPA